jgi:hypothetical protein
VAWALSVPEKVSTEWFFDFWLKCFILCLKPGLRWVGCDSTIARFPMARNLIFSNLLNAANRPMVHWLCKFLADDRGIEREVRAMEGARLSRNNFAAGLILTVVFLSLAAASLRAEDGLADVIERL